MWDQRNTKDLFALEKEERKKKGKLPSQQQIKDPISWHQLTDSDCLLEKETNVVFWITVPVEAFLHSKANQKHKALISRSSFSRNRKVTGKSSDSWTSSISAISPETKGKGRPRALAQSYAHKDSAAKPFPGTCRIVSAFTQAQHPYNSSPSSLMWGQLLQQAHSHSSFWGGRMLVFSWLQCLKYLPIFSTAVPRGLLQNAGQCSLSFLVIQEIVVMKKKGLNNQIMTCIENNTLLPQFSDILPAISPGQGVAASFQHLAWALSIALPPSSRLFPQIRNCFALLETRKHPPLVRDAVCTQGKEWRIKNMSSVCIGYTHTHTHI